MGDDALLQSEEILSMNDKIGTFVLVSLEQSSDTDVDLFVVKPPPSVLEIQEWDDFTSGSRLCERCAKACGYFAYCVRSHWENEAQKSKDHPLTDEDAGDEVETTNERETQENNEKPQPACQLHSSIKTVEAGAGSGCHLCTIIAMQLNILLHKYHAQRVLESHIEMCWQSEVDLTGTKKKRDKKSTGPIRINFALTHPAAKRSSSNYMNFLRLQFWPFEENRDLFRYPFEAGDSSGAEAEPFSKAVRTRYQLGDERGLYLDRKSNSGSDITQDMARDWLERCERNLDGKHDICDRANAGPPPTRLLDVEAVSTTGKLRLISLEIEPDSFLTDMRYVTLSHCWGSWGPQELPSLTKSNLIERQQGGIDLDDLPQTFCDAVKIAQWFDIKWLWIDSLCILQDSKADWQHEALRMAEVYSNAVFNISADAAYDARGGCFTDRSPLQVSPMQLSFDTMDDAKFWVTVDDRHLFEGISEGPIASRAWCFQERQLSRRVLHFTDKELIWECCATGSDFASETFPNGAILDTVFSKKPKFQSYGKLEGERLYQTWNELCKQYSERHLSHVSDRVVALSGLAKQITSQIPNDQYVAGLWRSTLPQGLLWKTAEGTQRLPNDPYLAPSWSWLSTGPITYMWGDEQKYSDDSSAVPVAEVSDVRVCLVVPDDPTASLTHASLVIKSLLRRVEVRPDYEEKPWYMLAVGGGHMHELYIEGSGEISTGGPDIGHHNRFSFTFDTEPHPKTGRPRVSGFFLPIDYQKPQKDTEAILRGILLDKAESKHMYTRIGTLEVTGTYILRMLYRLKAGTEAEVAATDWKMLEDAHGPDWRRFGPDPTRNVVEDEEDADPEGLESGIESLQVRNNAQNTLSSLFTQDSARDSDIFEKVSPKEITIL